MLEIIFTGIGSAIFSVVVYLYKNWRKTVNEDKQAYQNYLWWLQLNAEIISKFLMMPCVLKCFLMTS